MLLVVDNYDSFTYNLVQYLGELGGNPFVVRNDEICFTALKKDPPSSIVISPGPGTPGEAGQTLEIIAEFAGKVPILGVCLGHQAIGEAFGGKVVGAPALMHGKLSSVYHNGQGIFKNIISPFLAVRYHSLILAEESLPAELKITARSEDGLIMGIRHKKYFIVGVQFHPESVLTENGKKIIDNFFKEAVLEVGSERLEVGRGKLEVRG